MSQPFWESQPQILIDPNQLAKFWPTPQMTFVDRLNAMMRLSVYASLIMVLVTKNLNWLILMVFAALLIHMMWIYHPEGAESVQPFTPEELKKITGSNSVEQYAIDQRSGEVVQKPTQDNPFMNVLISDYADAPNRPPAANPDDPEIKAEIDRLFRRNLPQEMDDIFGRNNSQREFVTQPSTTIPNDRDTFARWCYASPSMCKDGKMGWCLKYEDLRRGGRL